MIRDGQQFDDLNSLVTKICNLHIQDQRLIEKFTINQLLHCIDNLKITQIEQFVFQIDKSIDVSQQRIDLMRFVQGMVKVIQHTELETLFLVITLVDLFKQILDLYEIKETILLKDFTNFICDTLLKQQDNYIVKSKQILPKRQINPEQERIRKVDMDPPELLGETPEGLSRILNNKIWTDNQHHTNHRIKSAVYIEEKKQIIILDSLSPKLDIYNQYCKKLGEIYPARDDDKDFIIVDFTFSKRQSRVKIQQLSELGACLMDTSLCFWDCSDNFKYCKNFNINSQSQHYQTKIWYLEHFTAWISTDDTNKLYEWNLQSEKIKRILFKHTSQIIDVVEVDYLQLILIATYDRFIHLQNLSSLNKLQRIDLTDGGIHSIKFSCQFQTILVAGYCNHIKLYSLHNECFDSSYQGALIGHGSMITGLQIIQNSPMVVTCDDSGVLKLWDIRSLQCLQTLSIGQKTIMHTMMDMSDTGKIALIGIRLYVIRFETIQKNKLAEDKIYAIHIDYNFKSDELLVATRKDVRFYSIQNGRLTKVLKNLTKESEEEITAFQMIKMKKSFLIGNQRGIVTAHNFAGEVIEQLDFMANEISGFKLDPINNLFLVSSECNLNIQSFQKVTVADYLKFANKPHTLRDFNNLHKQRMVTCVELSVYHNLIFTGSNTQHILAFDYEFGKLLGTITLPQDNEPTQIQCVNGYSLLLVGTNQGYMICFHFFLKKNLELKFRTMILCDLHTIIRDHLSDSDMIDINYKSFLKKILYDVTCVENQQPQKQSVTKEQNIYSEKVTPVDINPQQIKTFLLYLSLANGCILILDLTQELISIVAKYVTHQPPAYSRLNYNPQRVSSEDIRASEAKSISEGTAINFSATEVVELLSDFTDEMESPQIRIQNIKILKTELQETQTRKIIHLKKTHIVSYFKAHADVITVMSLLETSTLYLMTASQDSYIKLWDIVIFRKQRFSPNQQPKPTCSLNLNHPLPLLWNLRDNQKQKEQRKVLYAMKVIDIITKKYINEDIPFDEKDLSLQPLFLFVVNNSQIVPNSKNQTDDIVLMRDEFSPNDLNVKKARNLFISELRGPHLKQLDNVKHLEDMAQNHVIIKPIVKTQMELKLQEIQELCNQDRRKDPFKDEEKLGFQFLVDENYRSKFYVDQTSQKPSIEKFRSGMEQKLLEFISPAKFSPKTHKRSKLPSISWSIRLQPAPQVKHQTVLQNTLIKQLSNKDINSAKILNPNKRVSESSTHLYQISQLKDDLSLFSLQKPQSKKKKNSQSGLYFSKQQSMVLEQNQTNNNSKYRSANTSSINQSVITKMNDSTIQRNENNVVAQHKVFNDMMKCMSKNVLRSQLKLPNLKGMHFDLNHDEISQQLNEQQFSTIQKEELTIFQSQENSYQLEHEDQFKNELDQVHANISDKIKCKLQSLLKRQDSDQDIISSQLKINISKQIQSIQDPNFIENLQKQRDKDYKKTKSRMPIFMKQKL